MPRPTPGARAGAGWWLRSKSGGFAAVVAAVITPQQLTVAAAIVARTHVVMYAILTGEPSLSQRQLTGNGGLPAMGAFSSRFNPRPGQDMRRELVEVRGKGARGDNSPRRRRQWYSVTYLADDGQGHVAKE